MRHFPDNGRIYVRRDQRDILYHRAHLPLHHNTKVYFTLIPCYLPRTNTMLSSKNYYYVIFEELLPCYLRRKLTKNTKLLLLDYVQQDLHVEVCPPKISTNIEVQFQSKSGEHKSDNIEVQFSSKSGW